MQTHNRGLIIKPIEIGDNWVFGSSLSIGSLKGEQLLQLDGQWHSYLPPGERQFNAKIDTQACVSFSFNNAVEILKRRVFERTENYSDRYLAVASGTTPIGNDPHRVGETLRQKGVPYEAEYPFTDELDTWEKVYTPILPHITTSALRFPAEFAFYHEYVAATPAQMMLALRYSPLPAAVFAWAQDEEGYYYMPQGTMQNHYVVVVGYEKGKFWWVFDSYDVLDPGNFLKKVRWDMPFVMVKRIALTRQIVVESAWQRFLAWFARILPETTAMTREALKEPVIPLEPTPEPEPIQPLQTDKAVLLDDFCDAIKKHEGWFLGSRIQRNNNPGNCRFSSEGYLTKYGNVKRDTQNFAIFPSYELGWLYLQNLILHKAKQHPNWTISTFFADEDEGYAPVSDGNNSLRYADVVRTRMGVDPLWTLRNLL